MPSSLAPKIQIGAPGSSSEAAAWSASSSAGCHSRMDPIGFALENFDAVGRWRDQDGGVPIDVVSRLPSGTMVDGLDGVKALLLDDPEAFVDEYSWPVAASVQTVYRAIPHMNPWCLHV